MRTDGCPKRVWRLVDAGRLRIQGATVTFERGKRWISLQGVAAVFNRARRAPEGRHPHDAGLDLGVKVLATVADSEGVVLRVVGR